MSRLLLRRREVLLPTALGWLVLLAVATGAFLGLRTYWYNFLAITEPAPGARVLVVEGWLSERTLAEAADRFRGGGYERIAVTGGPIDRGSRLVAAGSFAELGAMDLRRLLPEARIAAVPAPPSAQDRTFLSAVMLREWGRKEAVDLRVFDLYSGEVHARRSRKVFEMAFGPGTQVGVIASEPNEYFKDRWWTTSVGVKAVLGESIGLAWTYCCFWPPPQGSHEERWALPRKSGK